MGEVVYLLWYIPNMGAILNLSNFCLMERGSYDISNNIGIFCLVHSCKQIRSSSYGSKVTTHFVGGNQKMALTTEERIEIILMSVERSFRVITADFNNRHPERVLTILLQTKNTVFFVRKLHYYIYIFFFSFLHLTTITCGPDNTNRLS